MNTPDILKDTVVFLAAAVISVPLSKKLGLGSILGYLLAGICIGPWVLGFIGDPEGLLHFSEFGVVMFLFLVGLELKPSRLWAMRSDILGTGLAQVLFTSAAVAAATYAFTADWRLSAMAGMALSLSSTAMALQAIQERNILSTPAGEKSFSVLLFQDLAVIPMLAIVPLMAPLASGTVTPEALSAGELGAAASLWTFVKPVAVIAGIIAAGLVLTRPLFRIIASSGVREIFTATSLLLVVGIAVLMDSVGMSMALGTFLAGVLLSESEYRHELEANIEPFKSLLLGLFFISVGMSLDPTPITSSPVQVTGAVAGLMLLKGVILFGIARFRRMDNSQSLTSACLLAQASEFAFVLFGMARMNGVLDASSVSFLNVVVTLSMLLTPLVIIAHDLVNRRLFRVVPKAGPQESFHNLEDSGIIIAGYGRVGQIVSRFLHTCHFSATVLDHDPTHIEMIRKFGYKVYYGDVTRLDLLEQAGMARARMFICAIDDPDQALAAVDLVQKHFPHVQILSRCRNLSHLFGLMERKIAFASRETFSSALEIGVEALRHLGFSHYRAVRVSQRFRRLDEIGNDSLYAASRADQDISSIARAARTQLEEQLRSENAVFLEHPDRGWS